MTTKENPLLTINEGETREQAIERWWHDNGLDHAAARSKRKETYAKQKAESMNVYRVRSGNNIITES